MPKAEISWKRVTEEGEKLQVYAQHVGREYHFFHRAKRFDVWQRVKEPPLEDWLELNSAYFLNPKTPAKLMPRGLMLAGKPGVGKSMGAKAIAQHFDIPLFRLDISTTLAKFVGESEARVARSLATVDRESPCVLLLDEVEKIFSGNDV